MSASLPRLVLAPIWVGYFCAGPFITAGLNQQGRAESSDKLYCIRSYLRLNERPGQTVICNPEIEWSKLLCLLSAFPRVFVPSLFVWVRSFNSEKMLKRYERERKRKKHTHSNAKIRTRPSPPAVSFACRKLIQAAKEFISEYYVTIT